MACHIFYVLFVDFTVLIMLDCVHFYAGAIDIIYFHCLENTITSDTCKYSATI
jgi:hypothetical protein